MFSSIFIRGQMHKLNMTTVSLAVLSWNFLFSAVERNLFVGFLNMKIVGVGHIRVTDGSVDLFNEPFDM